MKHLKLLIVDDEKEILEILQEYLLEKFFCEVKVEENGLDAFLTSQNEKFDLIMTDQRMPLINGNGFIQAIRQKGGPNKNTPVLFFSQFIDEAKVGIDVYEGVFFLDKSNFKSKINNYMVMILGETLVLKNT